MVKTINAYQLRQNLGRLLEEVYYQSAQLIVERSGRPMAAIIPIPDFEKLTKRAPALSKAEAILANLQAVTERIGKEVGEMEDSAEVIRAARRGRGR